MQDRSILKKSEHSLSDVSWAQAYKSVGPVIERVEKSLPPDHPLRAAYEIWENLGKKNEIQAQICEGNLAALFDPPYAPPRDEILQEVSLPALVISAFLHLTKNQGEERARWIEPLLIATVLGEVPHSLPYHNNLHFRKVALHAARLIRAHNDMPEQKKPLGIKESAKLLIAACIHDLGHDGEGNIGQNQEYVPGRLENRSVELARPFLKEIGVEDHTLEQMAVMILCTDASRPDNPACPLTQLRSAAACVVDENSAVCAAGRGDIFKKLGADKTLTLLSVYLHEADIMNSAGVSSEQTAMETAQFKRERVGIQARPSDVLEFMGTICRGGFISPAGKILGQKAYEDIRRKAQIDFEKGNKAYFSEEES